MSMHIKAIHIATDNYETIVRNTPFTTEILDALKATHQYLYVVKETDGAIYVMPYRNLVFFGFGDSGKTWWSDVMIKSM